MAEFLMDKATEYLWLTRVMVLSSFGAYLTLALLAGIRRRKYSGVRRFLAWLAYSVTDIGTSITLTKVFINTTYIEEQQMFAFWAPFLLLHLGRPDNITCYAFDNKGFPLTQKCSLLYGIGVALYGSYKQGFMRSDRHLRAAFFIMLILASYKCVERAVALRRGSFANIHRSNKRKMVRRISIKDEGHKTDNDDVLLDAHGLLTVTMGAFAEYQVNIGGHGKSYSGWEDVCKVVEMEASLMYDMLYTKASVIHTWGGYIIRVLSPLATCTALYLFHSKEGKAMVSADLVVTYILLVGTLLLDVRWLLRALGSTWTYAFLVDDDEEESRGRHRWLKKAGRRVRRAGRQSWYLLRRFLVSLDLARLALRSGPSGHRLLPGSGVGQCNLLHECSTPHVKKNIDAKDELFGVVCEYLVMDFHRFLKIYKPRELTDYMRDNARICSFERNLIAFHIATDIFLLCRHCSSQIESEASAKYEKQIRAISDYMMFLLDQRKHMVLPPGDKGNHCKNARLDLKKIWSERRPSGSQTREAELAINLLDMDENETHENNRKTSLLSDRDDTLALGADWAFRLLHVLEPETYDSGQHPISAGIRSRVQSVRGLEDLILVFNGDAQRNIEHSNIEHSTNRDRERSNHEEQRELFEYMLRLILVSWIRLLTFTSNQCSRESHAKQLSRGGELLTIVWLLNQHRENGRISIESPWIL